MSNMSNTCILLKDEPGNGNMSHTDAHIYLQLSKKDTNYELIIDIMNFQTENMIQMWFIDLSKIIDNFSISVFEDSRMILSEIPDFSGKYRWDYTFDKFISDSTLFLTDKDCDVYNGIHQNHNINTEWDEQIKLLIDNEKEPKKSIGVFHKIDISDQVYAKMPYDGLCDRFNDYSSKHYPLTNIIGLPYTRTITQIRFTSPDYVTLDKIIKQSYFKIMGKEKTHYILHPHILCKSLSYFNNKESHGIYYHDKLIYPNILCVPIAFVKSMLKTGELVAKLDNVEELRNWLDSRCANNGMCLKLGKDMEDVRNIYYTNHKFHSYSNINKYFDSSDKNEMYRILNVNYKWHIEYGVILNSNSNENKSEQMKTKIKITGKNRTIKRMVIDNGCELSAKYHDEWKTSFNGQLVFNKYVLMKELPEISKMIISPYGPINEALIYIDGFENSTHKLVN